MTVPLSLRDCLIALICAVSGIFLASDYDFQVSKQ